MKKIHRSIVESTNIKVTMKFEKQQIKKKVDFEIKVDFDENEVRKLSFLNNFTDGRDF